MLYRAPFSAGRMQAGRIPYAFPEVSDYWWAGNGIAQADATERVSGWTPLKGSHVLAQSTTSAQPILLPYAGVNYLWLPGVAGNNASTPDSVPLSITGDIDIRVHLVAKDYTPATDQDINGKWAATGNQRGWSLQLPSGGNSGKLVLTWSTNGTNSVSAVSTANTGLTDNTDAWVRAVLDVDDGGVYTVKFYKSTDTTNDPNAVTWTQVGTTVTGGATTSIADTTAILQVGGTDGGVFDGKIYRCAIYSVIGGSTPVFDANFTSVAEGATSFTESSSNGATVTINSTGAKPAQIVGSQQILTDGSDDFLKTGAFTLDQPLTSIMVVKQVTWTAGDVFISGVDGSNECQIGQRNASPELQLYAGTLVAGNTGLAVGSYGVASAVFNGASSRLQINLNTATTGNAGAQNMGAVTIGAASGGSQGFANIQVKAAAVCNSALSQSRLNQLIRAMGAHNAVAT